MHKILWLLFVGVCFVPFVSAQQGWVLPHLQELDEANALSKNGVHLSSDETSLLKRAAAKVVDECVKESDAMEHETDNGLPRSFRVKRIAIGPGGVTGLVVQGMGSCMCGATGNCPFWLIGENGSPRLLLTEPVIQSFAIESVQSHGYYDVVLGSHDSAMRIDLQRFRFDGTRYRRHGCALLESGDQFGNQLRRPRITPSPCS